MKKLLTMALALMLALILALPALADKNYDGPMPLYANKKTVKVFKSQSKDSKVIKKLKGADSVTPDLVSDDGKWIGILIEDTKKGGQKIGWVLASQLVDYVPQSICSHKWGDWTVDQKATCTKEGYRWRLCKKCGLRDEQIPEAIERLKRAWE